MYTYNITFVAAPEREQELIRYLHLRLIPVLFSEGGEACNPELKKLIEAGGEKPDSEHGVSIALAATLPSEASAHHWHDHILAEALEDFHQQFGSQALFFVTLLENLSL